IILRKIAYILKFDIFEEYRIAVEGHTDAVPITNSKKYPSNWELSVLRSASVVRYFNDKTNIPGDRLQATGYSYFKPFVNKAPIKGIGVPENRRVEIVLFNVKDGKY
ncbi:OmpA family protein, partial [bacterium]|nr:OmpA family protein [bacterium]